MIGSTGKTADAIKAIAATFEKVSDLWIEKTTLEIELINAHVERLRWQQKQSQRSQAPPKG
jgi:hypothetical protein